MPLLGRLGPVLTKTSKKVRFLKSRKRFFNHFEAFETLKLSVSPRREPYFSKNHFFLIFSILCCSWPVLGALLASFWRSWGALGAILGHLGPGQGKSKRSGQVKSGQVWSRWPWGPAGSGSEARSGQGGVAPSYKDGSALENPSSSCMVISNKNENFNYFSKFYAWFCGGRVDLKDLGLYGCFGGLGCESEQDLKASWVHFCWF